MLDMIEYKALRVEQGWPLSFVPFDPAAPQRGGTHFEAWLLAVISNRLCE